jgi:O-methyltransferase
MGCSILKKIAQKVGTKLVLSVRLFQGLMIYRRYRHFTMVTPSLFARNLALCATKAPASGCIVECGVWRGGMSAGIADIIPGRLHVLFDSFEGLPPAQEIDGEAAVSWQRNSSSPHYVDNCRAERGYAERAMRMSSAKRFKLVEGWFADTLAAFAPEEPIAVLRLDGDWYDSTLQCLTALYPHVMRGGLIIIDDYFTWDGCARAVHDYLSRTQAIERIEGGDNLCFMIKR